MASGGFLAKLESLAKGPRNSAIEYKHWSEGITTMKPKQTWTLRRKKTQI